MWRYTYNLRGIYETPTLTRPGAGCARGRKYFRVRESGRTILTEYESKQLLDSYGIPTVETRIAVT